MCSCLALPSVLRIQLSFIVVRRLSVYSAFTPVPSCSYFFFACFARLLSDMHSDSQGLGSPFMMNIKGVKPQMLQPRLLTKTGRML